MIRISNSIYASLAQRYWNPAWTPERNHQVYGREASAEGVGANLRIQLETAADEEGLQRHLDQLKRLVDHGSFPSTLEKLTVYLAEQLPAGVWTALTLWETAHLGCT